MRNLAMVALLVLVGCGSKTSGDNDAATGDGGGGGTDDAAQPDASTAGITCGTMTCTTGMDCCITFANPMYECIAGGSRCQGISQACDGPEDCTMGERCCGATGGGDIACQPGGMCRELCHTPADCSMPNSMCCTAMFFDYSYCAQFCPQ
jgi:hypothetical protein